MRIFKQHNKKFLELFTRKLEECLHCDRVLKSAELPLPLLYSIILKYEQVFRKYLHWNKINYFLVKEITGFVELL